MLFIHLDVTQLAVLKTTSWELLSFNGNIPVNCLTMQKEACNYSWMRGWLSKGSDTSGRQSAVSGPSFRGVSCTVKISACDEKLTKKGKVL